MPRTTPPPRSRARGPVACCLLNTVSGPDQEGPSASEIRSYKYIPNRLLVDPSWRTAHSDCRSRSIHWGTQPPTVASNLKPGAVDPRGATGSRGYSLLPIPCHEALTVRGAAATTAGGGGPGRAGGGRAARRGRAHRPLVVRPTRHRQRRPARRVARTGWRAVGRRGGCVGRRGGCVVRRGGGGVGGACSCWRACVATARAARGRWWVVCWCWVCFYD